MLNLMQTAFGPPIDLDKRARDWNMHSPASPLPPHCPVDLRPDTDWRAHLRALARR